MKELIIDLDNTITIEGKEDYHSKKPNKDVIEKMKEYKKEGFDITIFTARNMRTYKGDVGLITKNTLPVITDWLKKHDVPHDKIIIGKPWCGRDGFYVDDKAIRPDEFVNLDYKEIKELIG